MITRNRVVVTLLALAPLCGCAEPEFRPLQSKPSTPLEMAAASYNLHLGGQDLGDVKVWSSGTPARPVAGADEKRQLSVELQVRNDTRSNMWVDLDATTFEVYTEDGNRLQVSGPLEVRGTATVPARSTRRLELIYPLPEPVKLRRVEGYELSWALETGEEERRLTYSTAFRRADQRYYPYTYPYYYYGPGWGWSAGAGYGWRYGL